MSETKPCKWCKGDKKSSENGPCYWCHGTGFDLRHTDELVCPYCGHEQSDSWEWLNGQEGDDETMCGECCKTFQASRHVEVTYSSQPVREDTPS